MEPTLINKAVRELLDKMVADFQGFRWESLCTFSDGKGLTIIELNVYREKGSEMLGRIAYHLESGEVLNFQYRGYEEAAPEGIIDLLLDLHNLEQQRAPRNSG